MRQRGEHTPHIFVGIADPLAIRRDPQQPLGHDQAEQLDIGQGRFASRMAMSRKAESGQDPIMRDARKVWSGGCSNPPRD